MSINQKIEKIVIIITLGGGSAKVNYYFLFFKNFVPYVLKIIFRH